MFLIPRIRRSGSSSVMRSTSRNGYRCGRIRSIAEWSNGSVKSKTVQYTSALHRSSQPSGAAGAGVDQPVLRSMKEFTMRRTLVATLVISASVATAWAQKRPVTFDDVLQIKTVASAAVSPDGVDVIYTVRGWESASERDKDRMEARSHVWRVPANASVAARQITFGERGESQPAWSPDGRSISFLAARGTGTGDDAPRPQVYVMRADGGESWALTDAKEGVSAYAWSPDSSRIVYVTNDPRSKEEDANVKKRDDERVFEGDFRYAHAWVIDVETKAAT